MPRDKLSIVSKKAFCLGLFVSIVMIIGPPDVLAVESEDELETPSIELLEFLADFETEDGRWMGPSELEAMKETGWSGQALEAAKDE